MCLNNQCLQTPGGMEKKNAEASQSVNSSFPLPDIPTDLGRFAHGQTSITCDAKFFQTHFMQRGNVRFR